MDLVAWNCNMAFRKKWPTVIAYQPDIMIISECESEEKFKAKQQIPFVNEFIWVGDNPNKGISIISFNGYHIRLSKYYNKAFRYIVPIEVYGKEKYTLFAIWAMPDQENKQKSYIGQIWLALNYYAELIDEQTILAGDFNSNKLWDNTRKTANHTAVVDFLAQRDIHSLYHLKSGEEQGDEFSATLFLLKNRTKPYHIDYCFTPRHSINANTRIEVGEYEDWIKWSDHMPLIIHKIGNPSY